MARIGFTADHVNGALARFDEMHGVRIAQSLARTLRKRLFRKQRL